MWGKISRAIWCIEGDLKLKRMYVSLGSPYPAVICIDNNGDLLWEIPTKRPVQIIKISPTSRFIYLYEGKRRLPSSLTCLDFQGNIRWKKFLESNVHSIDLLLDEEGCITGTSDSKVLLFDNKGNEVDALLLEKWANKLKVFLVNDHVVAVSDRGYLHVVDVESRRLVKKSTVNLNKGVPLLKVFNEHIGLIDGCSGERSILHLYNPEEETYFDINYLGRVNDFVYAGSRIWAVVDNSIITLYDENLGHVFTNTLNSRINGFTVDSFGSYALVGTDNFNLFFLDHRGEMIWGKDTRGRYLPASYAQKNFHTIPVGEIIEENPQEAECSSNMLFINSVEKYFLEKRELNGAAMPSELEMEPSLCVEEPPLDEEWIIESARNKPRSLIRNFRPLPVEKKVSIQSGIVNTKKRPTFVVQIENTTDHSLEDVSIQIELDKPLFQIKKEVTEVPLVRPNIAKKALVRFISTGVEGTCVGRGQITYYSNGEKSEEYLKNFQLTNQWLPLEPHILPEDDWELFVKGLECMEVDIFTSLTPHYLSGVIETTVRERGFNEIKLEREQKEFYQYYSASYASWHYGLKVMIKPSTVDRGMSIISMLFYSEDDKLIRLKDMLVSSLETRLSVEEEAVRSRLYKDYSVWEEKRPNKYADKMGEIVIKAPEWSEATEVKAPVWGPDALPTQTYAKEGLSSDYNIYDKYSEYYEEYFMPYPKNKNAISIKPRKGLVYLFEDPRPVRAFRVFRAMISHGLLGKFVTREFPQKTLEKYKLDDVPYMWLSKSREKNSLAPTDTEKIRFNLIKFLKDEDKKGNTVVLLDGMEYLITHNSFITILKLVQALKDQISLTDGTLLIPISPNTLQEREIKLVEREADVVIQ